MFDHQNINRRRRQFRNLKNVDFSIILARRAQKSDDDANPIKNIANVCEHFSPLPCEGRFRSYRLRSECVSIK